MMPKGAKIEGGYCTVTDEAGTDYRTIAKIMTDSGEKMNHASARNHVIRAMRKVAMDVCEGLNIPKTSEKLDEMAASPYFQSAISDILQMMEVEDT